MVTAEKTVRCPACRSEFSDVECEGVDACPACGNPGVPMAIDRDRDLRINIHELRILTIWASNWAAEKCDASARRSLKGILGALREQLPGECLTMDDEFKELAKLGSRVEVRDSAGDVKVYEGKKPS